MHGLIFERFFDRLASIKTPYHCLTQRTIIANPHELSLAVGQILSWAQISLRPRLYLKVGTSVPPDHHLVCEPLSAVVLYIDFPQ